jgi:putative transposase
MPRVSRIVIPGVPHHITQRGNNRQDVFFVDDDREVYLSLLREQADRYGLAVVGYSLMANHVHVVGTPVGADSLGKAVGRTHLLYAQYINRLHERTGHLWQGRFFSCALDEAHCWAALSYVERNPVRAGLVRNAWRYRWSSARAHCEGDDPTGLLDLGGWRKVWDPRRWREELRRRGDEEVREGLRVRTRTGRPLGSDSFLSKIERAVGRRLRPLPVGRPSTRKAGKRAGKPARRKAGKPARRKAGKPARRKAGKPKKRKQRTRK